MWKMRRSLGDYTYRNKIEVTLGAPGFGEVLYMLVEQSMTAGITKWFKRLVYFWFSYHIVFAIAFTIFGLLFWHIGALSSKAHDDATRRSIHLGFFFLAGFYTYRAGIVFLIMLGIKQRTTRTMHYIIVLASSSIIADILRAIYLLDQMSAMATFGIIWGSLAEDVLVSGSMLLFFLSPLVRAQFQRREAAMLGSDVECDK